jgi:hypothetical protein
MFLASTNGMRIRAVLVVLLLALLPGPTWGAELRLSREIPARGDDIAARLDGTVAELKRELAALGCRRITAAYWSDTVPLTRLRVEVRCRDGEDDAVAALPGESAR